LALPDGQIVARTTQPFTLFDRASKHAPDALPIWADDPAVRDWLSRHGYTLDAEAGLRITAQWDEDTWRYVKRGGRVLLCAASPQALPETPVTIEARRHTPWSGDWASSFAWVRPGVTRLPGGPILDFGWQGVFPEHVITGLASEHTLAGLFVGWVHMGAALIGTVPLGEGVLAVTTFPVLPPDSSPVRTVLLHDLIRAVSRRENNR
ncbi:MAG: hypothetical protein JW910_18370, partial [Anaerolineae bacterium]|nr:hypothetical protein [Anaerolineae bacterium]